MHYQPYKNYTQHHYIYIPIYYTALLHAINNALSAHINCIYYIFIKMQCDFNDIKITELYNITLA